MSPLGQHGGAAGLRENPHEPDFRVHSGANFRAGIWDEEDGVYQYDAIGNLIINTLASR